MSTTLPVIDIAELLHAISTDSPDTDVHIASVSAQIRNAVTASGFFYFWLPDIAFTANPRPGSAQSRRPSHSRLRPKCYATLGFTQPLHFEIGRQTTFIDVEII